MDKITFIAMACHEANRAYCMSLGDTSQPPWAQAPDWQKASAIAGVKMHLANPDATPEQSHEAWMAQKAAEGWKFGPIKDAKTKEHPCMVPYADLPQSQRSKDYIFKGVVHALRGLPDNPLAPPAPTAAPQPVSSAQPSLVPIKYVGRRETYKDALYSGMTFAKGQTRMVPVDKANQMLRHPDVYVRGQIVEAVTSPAAEPAAETKRGANPALDEDTENRMEDVRRSLQTMNRRTLANFIRVNFGREIDPDSMTPEQMRQQASILLDQYGMPA